MKKIIIDRKNNTFKIEGDNENYPPTIHNFNIWNEYKIIEDKEVLKKLSTVVLDF